MKKIWLASCAMCFCILAFSQQPNAQMISAEINPDKTITLYTGFDLDKPFVADISSFNWGSEAAANQSLQQWSNKNIELRSDQSAKKVTIILKKNDTTRGWTFNDWYYHLRKEK